MTSLKKLSEGPRQEFVSHIYSQWEYYLIVIYLFSSMMFTQFFWVPNHFTLEMDVNTKA